MFPDHPAVVFLKRGRYTKALSAPPSWRKGSARGAPSKPAFSLSTLCQMAQSSSMVFNVYWCTSGGPSNNTNVPGYPNTDQLTLRNRHFNNWRVKSTRALTCNDFCVKRGWRASGRTSCKTLWWGHAPGKNAPMSLGKR